MDAALTSYEQWQIDKYGNIITESHNQFETSADKTYYEKQSEFLPENVTGSYYYEEK